MIVPPVVVHCGIGLLIASLSLPLVLRQIPMNRWYGVRVSKAFVSDRHWYDINAYGGRLLLGYSLLLTAFGVLARDAAPPPSSLWSPVFIVGPLALIFPLLALIAAYARRLPEK